MAAKKKTKGRKGDAYVVVFKGDKSVRLSELRRALKDSVADLDLELQIVFIADDPGGGWFVRGGWSG